jgi:pyruvate/2-oxoglutarate dehydrogenase complex dihydrolipoamide dehydrogenase (E3) component
VKGSENAEVQGVFDDGQKRTEGFIAHKPKGNLSGTWVLQRGLETTEQGGIKINIPLNGSSFARVFAVGDCASMMKAVPEALAMGGAAAASLATQLEAEY